MKIVNKQGAKSILIALVAFLFGTNTLFGQDVLTSVRYIVKNVTLSADKKEISYDVYLHDINPQFVIAVPAFTFRLSAAASDLGMNPKLVSVTNGTNEIGAANATMQLKNGLWLMKFNQRRIALKYDNALRISDVADGTLIGTFHIKNADGTCFSENVSMTTSYSGASFLTKSTVAVLKPNTVQLATNSTTALAQENIQGLGVLTPEKMSEKTIRLYPNPTVDGFHVQISTGNIELKVCDMQGRVLITQMLSGDTYVDISSLNSGVYMVDLEGHVQKIIKK